MEKTCKSLLYITFCALLPTLLFAQGERWVYTFNGTGNAEDEAYVVTYGDDGNIYAAGYSTGNGTNQDFTIIGLTPQGDERWVYTYNGDNDSIDIAYDIIYGLDSNIYACGYCTNTTSGDDILVVSLNPDGDERWTYCYSHSPESYYECAKSIVYGDDGYLYITGTDDGPNVFSDIIIIKLSTQGSEQWISRTGGNNALASDIVYGMDDNLYIGGQTTGPTTLDRFTLICHDTTGAYRWQHAWGNSMWGDIAVKVVYGPDNNIYATGMANYKFIVRSYDTTGYCRWTYWPPVNSGYGGYDIVYGDNDNLYAVGRYYDVFHVISFTTLGDTAWTYSYGDSASEGRSVIYGYNDKLYTAGWMLDAVTLEDITIIRLDATGTEDWIYTYNGPGDGSDKAYSIVQGSDHYLYATGYCSDSTTNSDIVVVSLDTTTTHISENEQQSIPNNHYCSPSILTGPIPLPTDKPYKIFDITGREIKNANPSPGIYFIQTNDRYLHKVIKIR